MVFGEPVILLELSLPVSQRNTAGFARLRRIPAVSDSGDRLSSQGASGGNGKNSLFLDFGHPVI